VGEANRRKSKEAGVSDLIDIRQLKTKERIIENLKKAPIIQIACERAGIGRATYYRWRQTDRIFAQQADEALLEGSLLVNDLAESQLISAIREQNLGAIVFWLKHHHPNYTTKLEVTARLKSENEALTPKQEALVEKALKLAALIPSLKEEKENDSDAKP
jgi:predicted DNA binding protein